MLATFLKWMHKPIYASRIEALVQLIIPQLAESDRVLDVGCGAGALGRRILDSPSCPLGIEITGLEVLRRADRLIPIETYDGRQISFPDQAFDVVILADVLHHAADAHLLLSECARVTRRTLLVKDHKVEGFLAEKRLTLIDWAANKPYGIACSYQYNTLDEWTSWHDRHGLRVVEERNSVRLYPPVVDQLFGGRLQYWAVLSPRHALDGPARNVRSPDFATVPVRSLLQPVRITMAFWIVAAVLGVRFSVFVFKSVDEPTHGFVPHYAAARLLIEGEDVAEFYDDLWFEEQVTRFEPDVRDRFGANPPTMSLMMAPLAVTDYGAARAIWITASLIALLVTAVWLLRVLRIRGAWAPAFLSFVFLYQPAYENLSHGQMYVLALVLLCMAWSGYRRERSPLFGTSLGVLLVTKTAALMMWPLLLVQRRWRALAWGAGAFLMVAVASLPMIGIHAWQRYLVEAAKLPSNPLLAVTAYQTELSFFRHLFGPGGDLIGESMLDVPLLATSLPLIGGLVLLGISVYFAHHRTRSDLIFAAFVLMSLIISPVSLDYHYVMALLPVAILVGHVPSGRISRDGLLLIVGALMIGADLPYRSRRLFDGALALVAYPKLYGALLLWCLALLWSLRQSGGHGMALPPRTPVARRHTVARSWRRRGDRCPER